MNNDSSIKIPMSQYRELLGKYLAPQRRSVSLLAILLVFGLALQLVNPQIIRSFIDSAQTGSSLGRLVTLALVFTGIALVHQLVSVAEAYVGGLVSWTATNSLRNDLASHALALDVSYHNSRTPGEMIERVDGDSETLGGFLSTFALQMVGNGLMLVGILALLFREDWRAGLVLTVFAAVSAAILARLRNFSAANWKATREASAETFGFLEERLSGMEDIRSTGAQAHVMDGFLRQLRNWFLKFRRAGVTTSVMVNTSFFLFGAGNAIALAVGAWLHLNGSITIGTVYLIFHYTTMLNRPIEVFLGQLDLLQRATGSIYRIFELTQTRSEIVDGRGDPLPSGPLAATFEDVEFAYGGNEPLLNGFSFDLEPGKTLGLLGRTGAGKTTIARLLMRLYDVESGAVRLSGVDVRDTHLDELRRRVGMVSQNVQLFHGSVRDNLTFFDPSIPDEAILGVIDELGLTDWMASLSTGLDTTLDSGGAGLSAGEAQLLAFTRIFLRDPGLVILDEASSRLDRGTESLIQNAIQRLLEGRTVIVIAHHLVTIERVDEIMILQQGRIVEQGQRATLASDESSRFHGLLQTGLEEALT